MARKRPKMSDKYSEIFEAPKRRAVPNPLHAPTEDIDLSLIETDEPQLPILEQLKQRYIKEDARRNRIIEPKYKGYKILLPGPGGRHIYFKRSTPKKIIEWISNDEQMLQWASEFSARGGNRFAEVMFWAAYARRTGFNDNPNLQRMLMGDWPFTDQNHYFDWRAWKQEYDALIKGKIYDIPAAGIR